MYITSTQSFFKIGYIGPQCPDPFIWVKLEYKDFEKICIARRNPDQRHTDIGTKNDKLTPYFKLELVFHLYTVHIFKN